MTPRSKQEMNYKITRIVRDVAFGIVFATLGFVSQDKTLTDSPLLSFVTLGYLLILVVWYFLKMNVEIEIWSRVTSRYGLVDVNDIPADYRTIPRLGPVISTGVAETIVERAYIDRATKSVLQQITCRYGGGGDSRLSFATSYITMSIKFREDVPDIFIDGLKRNKFNKSTEMWALNKKLVPTTSLPALEGDFGRYFTVYAPRQSQLEGVVIVAPDVMLELKDKGYEFDYELSGNSLTIIRDAHIISSEDLSVFIDAALACVREIIPQIANHTFMASPPLPLSPWRTIVWGYMYSMRVLLGWALLALAYILVGGVLAQYLQFAR